MNSSFFVLFFTAVIFFVVGHIILGGDGLLSFLDSIILSELLLLLTLSISFLCCSWILWRPQQRILLIGKKMILVFSLHAKSFRAHTPSFSC